MAGKMKCFEYKVKNNGRTETHTIEATNRAYATQVAKTTHKEKFIEGSVRQKFQNEDTGHETLGMVGLE